MANKSESRTEHERQIEPYRELLNEIVAPELRKQINIIPEHITCLDPQKPKKLPKNKNKKKNRTLSRKEFSKLGLFKITKKDGLKYSDFEQLHELWKGYITEHLSINSEFKIPEVYDKRYDEFSRLLMKTDLHGSFIIVIKSKCPSYVGLSGIVILESKNILKVIGKDNKLRTLPKTESIFKIKIENIELTIIGKHLTIRPAEKSVKKIKNFIDLDLK